MPELVHINAFHKLAIASGVALLTCLSLLRFGMEPLTRVMICWNMFALSFLIISWITFFYTATDSIRRIAKSQDSSHFIVFVILLIAIISSIVAALFLLNGKDVQLMNKRLVTAIYLCAVIFSWLLHHTLYAIRYAHLYYGDESGARDKAGLIFPGDEEPDYMDFAYFSFDIGMTFQVSDVVITSKYIRKVVLAHSFLSFCFNTIIVGLTVNAIVNS